MTARKTKTIVVVRRLDLWHKALHWGASAAAVLSILTLLDYCAPKLSNLYNSNPAPWEGVAEHARDLADKLNPVNAAINQAADAATKATRAAETSLNLAESIQDKSDQADLCRAVDRLRTIESLLKSDPSNQILQDSQMMRQNERERLRKKFDAAGIVAECS